MTKWKIALPICYLFVLAIGIWSYLYDLQIDSANDPPLRQRLACTVIFFAFTLLQWLVFKSYAKKLPQLKEKRLKRAYTFFETLAILKALASIAIDCYVFGGMTLVFLLFSPFFLLGGAETTAGLGLSLTSLALTYLPWLFFVGISWLIETILLKKILPVKKRA